MTVSEPKQKKTKPEKETVEERVLRELSREYKRVNGVTPTITLNNGYYHVPGYSDGMSLKRLSVILRQLKQRSSL